MVTFHRRGPARVVGIIFFCLNKEVPTLVCLSCRLDEPVPHPDDPECSSCTCNKGTISCYTVCPYIEDICMETPVCTSPLNSSVVFQPGDTWTNEANCVCTCEVSHPVFPHCRSAAAFIRYYVCGWKQL